MRLGASPASAAALLRMNMEIDVRDVLPAVPAPTLVLHRAGIASARTFVASAAGSVSVIPDAVADGPCEGAT